jgi:hypothetical protein
MRRSLTKLVLLALLLPHLAADSQPGRADRLKWYGASRRLRR